MVTGDHVWHLYVVRTPLRDALRDYLAKQGIETGLHYPVPLHKQPILAHLKLNPADYPNANEWADHGLSLPIFAGMTADQQGVVIAAIKSFAF
jgi:dTDP-4-amino-4,6-dideoxygalactose transaminase